jgi:hypothetical protein
MFQRRRLPVVRGCLIALSLAVLSAWPFSDGTVLVRVDKVQPAAPPAALVANMQVVQEFEQAWLVRMPASDAARLADAGVSHAVLQPVGDEDRLFVVSTSAVRDLDALNAVGTVWRIDADATLLVAKDDNVRERVAPHLHLKRLADESDLKLTFHLAGRSAAMPRPRATAYAPGSARIPEMVSLVSAQTIGDTIKALEGFQTRYATMPSCEAAGTWLRDSFTAFGLAAERDPFVFGSGVQYPGTNVVATLRGRTAPEQVVIVAGHYDSTSNDPPRLAPGADDNASGTAVVVELARVLSRYSFDYTIKFIAFSAEEWGLYGSRHYAQAAKSAGEQIVGVVNLDMVAYTDRLPEDLDLIVNSRSEWLANAFATATAAWAPMPTLKVVNASLTYSDHSPFWDQGYSAMCGIEDANPSNPNYHKTYDTFGTLNMDFASAVARASLATVAMLAQPFVTPAPPSAVAVQSQLVGTMFMRATTAHVTWSAVPGAASYNVYRTTTSRAGYVRANRTPVTATSFADRFLPPGVTYYYVVASVDGNGGEGNYSREAVLAATTTSATRGR